LLPLGARFLPKPYTAHALMTTIREMSSAARAAAPARAVG
jgi:hypothetical protein